MTSSTGSPKPRARVLALYLPQYHPIPENDEWWGPGFTEWVTVAMARPLFPGHEQPKIPGELGFYDLRVAETREAQAELAREAGIEGFCYWHYWFGGRQLLERPFREVLASGKPDYPFCLGWANHSWQSVWDFGGTLTPRRGLKQQILLEQTYPGVEDHRRHFFHLLPAFGDDRYLEVDGKPIFYILNPTKIPDLRRFTDLWRELAREVGLPGLHLIGRGIPASDLDRLGFDARSYSRLHKARRLHSRSRLLDRVRFRYHFRKLARSPIIVPYREALQVFREQAGPSPLHTYPTVIPNFDNTPRARYSGLVLRESTPPLYEQHLEEAVASVEHKPFEHRIAFLQSWNEWAEGNYLEPDRRHGRSYLEATRKVLLRQDSVSSSPCHGEAIDVS